MTVETAPGQAGGTPGRTAEPGPARRPSLPQNILNDAIWLAVLARLLGDRRFQASVISGVLGVCALASLIKNNQAHPVRRAGAWYKKAGDPRRAG
jgi:hypothetical protein